MLVGTLTSDCNEFSGKIIPKTSFSRLGAPLKTSLLQDRDKSACEYIIRSRSTAEATINHQLLLAAAKHFPWSS